MARKIGNGETPEFKGFVGEALEFSGREVCELSSEPDAERFLFRAVIVEDREYTPLDDDTYDPDDPEYGEVNKAIIADYESGGWCYVGVAVEAAYRGHPLEAFGFHVSLWGMALNPGWDGGCVMRLNEVFRDHVLPDCASEALCARADMMAEFLRGGSDRLEKVVAESIPF